MSLEDTITGGEVTGFDVMSRLNINPVHTRDDYGKYKCSASDNFRASDEHEIVLTKTGKFLVEQKSAKLWAEVEEVDPDWLRTQISHFTLRPGANIIKLV